MLFPLCVDLDGTLIQTDSLYEMALLYLKKYPWGFFSLLVWLVKGRSYLKERLAFKAPLCVDVLPYNRKLLDWLRAEYAKGRQIYLVTAAHQQVAEAIAKHLNIFSGVFGSRAGVNLKASKKRAFLEKQFGFRKFDYAGNSAADLNVWPAARKAILVNCSQAVSRQCKTPVDRVFGGPKNALKTFLKAIRVHQYSKNFLIFLPALLGHKFLDFSLIPSLLWAFLAFCFLASSVYLWNDLLDLDADRRHAKKSKRPLAAGMLSIPFAVILAAGFFLVAVIISTKLPWSFRMIMGFYYGMTVLYSFWLKRLSLVDIFVLSCLYSLRVFAGMALIPGPYSPWLLLFAFFFFTSLAFVKRYAELHTQAGQEGQKIPGRSYKAEQRPMMAIFGVSSGYLSVFILALYLNSPQAVSLYQTPDLLYLICVFLLYWISRVWLKAALGEMDEDPVLFALKDKSSYFLGCVIFCVVFFASVYSVDRGISWPVVQAHISRTQTT
jgi:4-hydroxybenzoate polyprenyltransferase